ncbi:multicopper oxidase family protein [Effusibacillus lacus]|uniref:Copper-containing nitrite reductase n=1 Tax=Effusibacillus lacus TaxID=1348429 RepID=A0A292YNX3_9BACL|nr:multicopper oxidase family protein [Effusibacillus lacus]TCS74980.1 FtsP/CotA-like multicopper oxidase with cupredoxin domain [Effusibacillus lacus]GAX91648.1 multicopper oxidase [Effusibacillus lacus]
MNKQSKLILGGLGVLAIAGGIYYFAGSSMTSSNKQTVAQPKVVEENGQTVKQFEITAETKNIKLKDGTSVDAWTFGGSVPGTQIRVTEGDRVRITLANKLPEPTSIHWHGLPVPNAMDGIPGVTQNAVKPGESFTYEFTVTTPGTYWYHSHQKSVEQVDKGLYGTFIVVPKNATVKYDRDITLAFDEWMAGMDHGNMNMGSGGMSGMDHSKMNMGNGNNNISGMDHSNMGGSNQTASDKKEESHEDMMKQMYNVFTVNGTAGKLIQPIEVKAGERIKLRLVNAGFQTHKIHLGNQPFIVTNTDGQPVQDPVLVTDQLVAVAPGERYDLEFIATEGGFLIDDHADSPAAGDIQIPVKVLSSKNSVTLEHKNKGDLPTFDIMAYGQKTQPAEHKYNLEYTMVLDNVKDKSGNEIYTINGLTFPNTQPLSVKKGDWVKVKFVNRGTVDHPMHLHGHFFQVLTKNGQPVKGSIPSKDTLNIRPSEEYEVEFLADNEGNWMFHCHDLHHAAAGMVTLVNYEGYKPNFTPDPNDKPE